MLPLLLNLLLSLLFDLPLPLLLLLLALLFNLPLALFQLLLSLLLHLALTLLLLLLLLQLNLLLPLLLEVELVFLRRRRARRRESFGSEQALVLGCGLSLTWLQLLRTRLLDGGRAGRGRCGRRGALLEDRGFGQWLGLPWLRWLPRLLCKRLTRRRYSWRNVFCGRRRLPLRQRLHCLGRCSRWLDRGLAGLCRANRGNDRQWHALHSRKGMTWLDVTGWRRSRLTWQLELRALRRFACLLGYRRWQCWPDGSGGRMGYTSRGG